MIDTGRLRRCAEPSYALRSFASDQLFADIAAGIRAWPAWVFKGWLDIVLRYRRTAIGPLWLVITTGLMILCLAVIGPILFGGGNTNFIPYMVSGILCWTYISLSISELSSAFAENAADIRAVRTPYSTYLLRVLFRNQVVFAHLLIIYVIALILHEELIVPNLVLFAVNVAVVSVWLFLVGFWLSLVCSRFRDVQQVVTAILQVAFLLTPVFWDKSLILGKSRSWVVEFNPLFHLLELLRAPLLGSVPSASSYIVTAIGIACSLAIAIPLYRRCVHRLPLWL